MRMRLRDVVVGSEILLDKDELTEDNEIGIIYKVTNGKVLILGQEFIVLTYDHDNCLVSFVSRDTEVTVNKQYKRG